MTRLDFAGGFGAVWDLIRATNAYIEDSKPWALNKQGDADASRCACWAIVSSRCASSRCSRRR